MSFTALLQESACCIFKKYKCRSFGSLLANDPYDCEKVLTIDIVRTARMYDYQHFTNYYFFIYLAELSTCATASYYHKWGKIVKKYRFVLVFYITFCLDRLMKLVK